MACAHGMAFLRRLVIFWLALCWGMALNAAPREDILPTYEALLNQFGAALAQKGDHYKQDPDAYWAMVQDLVVPLWSKRASLEGLATAEKVAALSEAQQQSLDGILDRTVQRYAFEILDNYSGQRFVINDVTFDEHEPGRAVLDMTAVWDNFPDLDIELMLIDEGDMWRFYNIRYGWFSYIGAKKWAYRRGLSPERFDAFSTGLANKNRRHFQTLCNNEFVRSSQLCQNWHDRLLIE